MTDTQRDRYEARRLAATGLLRKVLDLHAPKEGRYTGGYYCAGCDAGAYAEAFPSWPCATAKLRLED